ncbi:hypothetical protein ABZX69_33035 [Streptomyces sp. NPDC004074]|uniref:hypothetical protein n=1 Tax=Streptomyces sp. NPDC004074 TaxID=3154277 RepID=UPI0033AB40DA
MPKKQTRTAQLARRIQAATGLPYTQCLKMCQPSEGSWGRLARALRAAGLIETADQLLAVDAATTEASTWFSAGGEIEQLYYSTDNERAQRTYSACSNAAEAALNRTGFDTHSYTPDAEAYHAAFLALSKAGTLPDGRTLARAALDVFADNPTWCSDVIRSQGRSPYCSRPHRPRDADRCGRQEGRPCDGPRGRRPA